jgi:4-amino-4-deoxy-L-arabinose transferase-like glycosyltransferase
MFLSGFYLLMVGLYLWAVPLGEAPDEPGHLQCIEQVITLGRLPIVDPKPTGVWSARSTLLSGAICYHMPLYYLVTGGMLRLFSESTITEQIPPNNRDYLYGANRPMFSHVDQPPQSAEIILLRLFSVALGALFIWAAVQIAHTLQPDHPDTALLAGILLAGWPQFLFMYRTISNDQLATTLAVLGLLAILRQRLPMAALLCALAVATKLTTLFTLGVLGVALLYLLWQQRQRWLPIQLFLITGIVIAPLILHPTTRLHLQQSLRRFSDQQPDGATFAYWQDVFVTSLASGYARFGWMDISVPQWQVLLFWGVLLVSAGIGIWRWPQTRYFALIIIFWLAGVGYSYWRINTNRFQPQFRFAFAALPLIVFFAANGLATVQKARPGRIVLAVAAIWVVVNIYLVTQVIMPVYAP